jgi:hypothetical protein
MVELSAGPVDGVSPAGGARPAATLGGMLSVNSYAPEYVDACRSNVDMTVAAYENLLAAARTANGTDTAPLDFAVSSFEPPFYHHLVLALDCYFNHRSRNLEGKDGNPLNEVRVLCASITQNEGKFAADRTIKWRPDQSVLGYHVGDEVRLTGADFARLSKAFFADLEAKYVKA